MAYTITNQCVGCSRCQSNCPTNAIQQVGSTFRIDPTLCNDCVDTHGVAQCWAVCPTNGGCIPVFQPTQDYWEAWFALHDRLVTRLKAVKQPTYWQTWFEKYASRMKHLRQT